MNRTTPYETMEEFLAQMNDQFADLSRRGPGWMPVARGHEALSLDVADRDDAFEVTVDVPGFDRDDVDVRLAESTLTVTATREHESEADAGAFIHRERAHRSLTRSIDLPAPVDETAVEADLTNGVLTITLPKEDEAEEAPPGVEVDVE